MHMFFLLRQLHCLRFNRYMVECEFEKFWKTRKRENVLIDTWWNVNSNKLGAGVEAVEVLIDTWWNVNKYGFVSVPCQYIVLIDTWWNVNQTNSASVQMLIAVLIDTWWNVNLFTKLSVTPPLWF